MEGELAWHGMSPEGDHTSGKEALPHRLRVLQAAHWSIHDRFCYHKHFPSLSHCESFSLVRWQNVNRFLGLFIYLQW